MRDADERRVNAHVKGEEAYRYGNLDVTAPVAELCKEVMRRERGVVFICGPSGMGKTLFAYDYLEARSRLMRALTCFSGDIRSVVSLARTLARARDTPVVGALRIPGGTGALDRVRDMRDASSLPSLPLAVITLRLLPRLCSVCRVPDGPYFVRGAAGSPCCAEGYEGKVRVAEVLVYRDMRDGKPCRSSGSLVVDGERRLGEGAIDVASFASSVW
jgi:hypothetical protein